MDEIKKKLDVFFSQYTLIDHKKGDILIRADENPEGVFYLKSGWVRLYLISDKAENFVLHIFKPGSFFPMMWALNNSYNGYYYECITPVKVMRAPLAELQTFLKSHPDVLMNLTKRLLLGIEGMLKRFEYIVFDNANHKVVTLLQYMADSFGREDEKGIVVQFPLTHKDIASWLGLTRETVSLQIEALKKKGVLAQKKRYMIISNPQKLERELHAHI